MIPRCSSKQMSGRWLSSGRSRYSICISSYSMKQASILPNRPFIIYFEQPLLLSTLILIFPMTDCLIQMWLYFSLLLWFIKSWIMKTIYYYSDALFLRLCYSDQWRECGSPLGEVLGYGSTNETRIPEGSRHELRDQ